MKKKVLITGVAGFIGSHIAKKFLLEGFEVVGVDDLSTGKLSNVPEGLDFICVDLSLSTSFKEFPNDCSLILHLAGQSSGEISYDDPIADLQKNVVSTLNLINYGIDVNADKIIYASSMSVYGDVPDMPVKEFTLLNPLSAYGVGKLSTEGYLRVYQKVLPYVSLRMFNVYGPGQDLTNLRQGMVSIYLAQAIQSGKIVVKGNLERFRDFIYIDDVVKAWYNAAINPDIKNIEINVGTGIRTTISELLHNICYHFSGTTYMVQGSTPGDQVGIYADINLASRYLELNKFTTLSEGLFLFKEWAQKQETSNKKLK